MMPVGDGQRDHLRHLVGVECDEARENLAMARKALEGWE